MYVRKNEHGLKNKKDGERMKYSCCGLYLSEDAQANRYRIERNV